MLADHPVDREPDEMNMNVIRGAAASLIVACGAIAPAHAATVLFTDDFGGGGYALDTDPTNWDTVNGTVDWLAPSNDYSISCADAVTGCVDLDGSVQDAGTMFTSGTFNLVAGTTYQLTAYVSGNQRGNLSPPLNAADSLAFGFLSGGNPVLQPGATGSIATILPNQPFTLISLSFTPTTSVLASIFFETGGGDNVGPILDNVSLAAVPLPAAAWLLLSGLVGFAALGRRKVS